MTKKAKHGFPPVIYVRREEDGTTRYFFADADPEKLMHECGDRAELARYSFADKVKAKVTVKLEEE